MPITFEPISSMPMTETVPDANKQFLEEFAAIECTHLAERAAAGQLVSVDRLADFLGVAPQVIVDAENGHRFFSLSTPNGTRLYPAFYASPYLNRGVIEAVSLQLGNLPGSSKWQFFNVPRLSLGERTPIEAIEAGETSLVLAAARAFREA